MFCSKCGTRLEEGSLFCSKCGNKLVEGTATDSENVQVNSSQQSSSQVDERNEVASSNNESQGAPTVNVADQGTSTKNSQSRETSIVPVQSAPTSNDYSQSTSEKKRKPHKIMRVVSAIVAVGVIGFTAVFLLAQGSKKETISLSSYCNVKFDGYDTDGTAKLSVNHDKFKKDVLALEEENQVVEKLEKAYKVSLDKKSDLRNGDKVHIKFDIDEKAADKLGYKLIGETKEVTVEGLTKIKEVDPFKSIKIEFSGVSPKITAELINDSKDEFIKGLYVKYDKKADIKVGDKVNVTIDCDDSLALSKGYRLTKKSKAYVCTEADHYAKQISELSEENINVMLEQSKKVVEDYIAQYSDYIKAGKFKYEGLYFMNLKDNVLSWSGTNRVIILYSADVLPAAREYRPSKVYFPVVFTNIVKKKDGTIKIENPASDKNYILGHNGVEVNYKTFRGYIDVQKLYDEVVTKYMEQYDCSMTDGLKQLHEKSQ